MDTTHQIGETSLHPMPGHQTFPSFESRLRRTWAGYKETFLTTVGLMLAGMASFVAAMGIGVLVAVLFGGGAAFAGGIDAGGTAAIIAVIIVAISASWLLTSWFTFAMYTAVLRKTSFSESLAAARSSYWRMLGVALVTVLAVIPGMFLFVVPGVILATRFRLWVMTTLVEGRGGFASVVRSRDLVYGRTWTLFWNLAIIALAAMLPGLLFARVAPFFNMVINILLAPFLTHFLKVFYDDCVAEKGTAWDAGRSKAGAYKVYATIGVLLMIGFFMALSYGVIRLAQYLPEIKDAIRMERESGLQGEDIRRLEEMGTGEESGASGSGIDFGLDKIGEVKLQ